MKTLLNKLMVPVFAFVVINLIGFWYHRNYEGAVAGSVVGMLVGFLIAETRTQTD